MSLATRSETGVERPVAVVTGAAGGIGRWIALGLAQAGYHVVLVGRDRQRCQAAEAWIAEQARGASTESLIVDLSLLAATRQAGDAIASRHPRISVLVNNAGVFESKRVTTAEGLERVLATNLLSPHVFTQALLPSLRRGAPSRIVTVGSSTSDRARLDPDHLVLGRRWSMVEAYSQSKLAVMINTFTLARQLRGSDVVTNVVHPGTVATGLVRTGGVIGLVWRCLAPFALTEQQGAETPLHAALAPEFAAVSGVYIKNRRAAPPNPRALDPVLAERVWRATEQLTAPADRSAPA